MLPDGVILQAKGNTLIKLREDPINEHFFPVFYDPPIISVFYKPLLDLDDWRNVSSTLTRPLTYSLPSRNPSDAV
jgi:hypothetical protein